MTAAPGWLAGQAYLGAAAYLALATPQILTAANVDGPPEAVRRVLQLWPFALFGSGYAGLWFRVRCGR